MFSEKELTLVNLDYFDLIMCASDVCEVVSKNHDHWLILKKQTHLSRKQLKKAEETGSGFQYSFVVYHRHADADGFHYHSEWISLLDVVLEIINHDDYRLRDRNGAFEQIAREYA